MNRLQFFHPQIKGKRPIGGGGGANVSGQCFGTPNPYNLSKKYGSTPPICTAVPPPVVSPSRFGSVTVWVWNPLQNKHLFDISKLIILYV